MKKPGDNGFSLIEVMVTVAIIGILATIAYPSYTRYVAEARRSDATINLTRIATLQDKFFTRCGRYADNLLGASGSAPNCAAGTMDTSLAASGATRDGHYTLTAVVTPGPGPLLAPGGGGFMLTAQPIDTPFTRQATVDNAFCNTFTINQTGLKTALGTDSLILGPNGGKCWRK